MKIIYIDPQSMRNLSIYDYGVLSEIQGDVTYICSKYYDHLLLPKHIQQKKYFSYNQCNSNVTKLLSYFWSSFMIFFYIMFHRPDIIHVQWFRVPQFDYSFYRLVKALLNVRLVFTAHNVLPHNSGETYFGIYNKTYQLFDSVIVHTAVTKEELVKKFKLSSEKIQVIPHGLLQMAYNEKAYKNSEYEFEQRYATKGKMVFTSLGEQSAYKGIDLLSQVWEESPELCQNEKLRLLIIGKQNGISLDNIKGISNVVVEDRKISNEEFVYLLRHTDVYLLPYRLISQSGALLTALNERVPVLVSDVGGLTDPLKIAEVGWSVTPDDYNSLKHMLIHLSTHPNEVAKIKNDANAWNTIANEYGWECISKATMEVYRHLF